MGLDKKSTADNQSKILATSTETEAEKSLVDSEMTEVNEITTDDNQKDNTVNAKATVNKVKK